MTLVPSSRLPAMSLEHGALSTIAPVTHLTKMGYYTTSKDALLATVMSLGILFSSRL